MSWQRHQDGEVWIFRFHSFLDFLQVDDHGPTDFTASAHRAGQKVRRERRQDWTLEQAQARALELYEGPEE